MKKKISDSGQRRRMAVFDIDGTIFRSSLLIEITEALVDAGLFPPGLRRIYTPAFRRWLDRSGPYSDYIGAVIRAFEGNIRGLPEKEVLKVARRVLAARQHRVYRYTRDLVDDLRRRGFYLLAISNSPRFILESFCRQLGFEKIYGRIYETDAAGRYTGHTNFLDLISDKAKILKRAAAKDFLTLRGSIGVGDTESDIPFLKMVANPICFNPNSLLFRHAQRRGWLVVVERKDVIYQHRTKVRAKIKPV